MKGRVFLSVVLGLILVGSVVGTVYAAPFNASQFCRNNGDFGFDHDTCVTYFNKGKGNGATAICKVYGDWGWLQLLGFKSHGDCVSYIKSL